MTADLTEFVSEYINLSDAEPGDIASMFKRRTLKNNDYLLRQGETCKDLVFVQSGCPRLYYIAGR